MDFSVRRIYDIKLKHIVFTHVSLIVYDKCRGHVTIVKAIFEDVILYASALHFPKVTGQRLYNMLIEPFFAYSFDSSVHIFENIKLRSFFTDDVINSVYFIIHFLLVNLAGSTPGFSCFLVRI